jgi:SAM-dependent MidA family methyltransferase
VEPPALAALLAGGRAVPFSELVEVALYDEADGFYATGGRAGGRADFLTSPEVGPLFGALVARLLDDTWERLGRPDPFVVVEAGAGPGTLARAVRVAEPRCGPTLAYVLVERSAAQRRLHAEHLPGWSGEVSGEGLAELTSAPGADGRPRFASSAELPAALTGLVLANELLDNLAFDIVRRTDEGAEQMLVVGAADGPELVVGPAAEAVAERLASLDVPTGAWVPWQQAARSWLADARGRLDRGRIVVVDYGAPTARLAARPDLGWLRTFRDNDRGGHPLDDIGRQDITADVAIDQLQLDHPASRVRTQAEWLRALGIDHLVEEGRRTWADRAHAPDLVALRGRSRVREAEALLDPDGLGSFVAMEWDIGLDPDRGSDGRH